MNWSVIKKYAKYLVILVAGIIVWIVYGFVVTKKRHDDTLPPDPKIWKAVEKAHEEALVERTKASVKSEEHQKELDRIQAIPDGKDRRKELARLLKTL